MVSLRNRPIQDVQRPPSVDDPKVYRALEAMATSLSSVIRFVQSFIQSEKWKPLVYQSDWVNFSATAQEGSYRKDPLGRVWLRGDFTAPGAHAAGDAIAVLPIGYRPLKASSYFIWTSTGVVGEVEITSEGRVNYLSGTLTHLSMSLSFDTVG